MACFLEFFFIFGWYSLLQVAGYSKGLEYFFGEDSGDTDAGAGLGVQLIDMQLRPLSFVASTSDLMSMAWNLGSASGSSYPALQGIMLLHDHVQVSTVGSEGVRKISNRSKKNENRTCC